MHEDTEAVPAVVSIKHARRLSDKIAIAFHHACDQSDRQSATALLKIMDEMVSRARAPETTHTEWRREIHSVVAAHERLWCIQHPDALS